MSEQWERDYEEIARRDFEREIYKQCDREDAERERDSQRSKPGADHE